MIFHPYHKLAPYLLIIINACFAATAAGSLQALIPVAAFIMFGYVLLILLDHDIISLGFGSWAGWGGTFASGPLVIKRISVRAYLLRKCAGENTRNNSK